ncbi:hypothetical protein ABD91_26100 [Lysinibacillus sphaericus]|uniref:hypothetical protein n=1 Tax=Lysinibacillus sphaericus TaxID=1421 RepID=UPI0018CC88C2|nr:hypothetical protein [Lysinibacillus sphaericus]MBG9694206.1 hypothetical protein [Lysinibacillus sphaericus]
MPNKRFYKRFAEAFQKSREIIMERQVILQMAHSATDRKYHEVRYELEDMKKKLDAASPGSEEAKKYKSEVDYLQQCLDGWQTTLDHIKIWSKELDAYGKQ